MVCQDVHNAVIDADGTRSLRTKTLLARTSNSLALRMCTLAPCLQLPADLGDGEFEKKGTVKQAAIPLNGCDMQISLYRCDELYLSDLWSTSCAQPLYQICSRPYDSDHGNDMVAIEPRFSHCSASMAVVRIA